MFRHIFINRLKCSVRDRSLLFWTLLFPVLLSTLFHLAFSDLQKHEAFATIPIAVVDNEGYQKDRAFQAVLQSASATAPSSGEDPLFDVTLSTRDEAEELLKDGKISGYILFDSPTPQLVVKSSGINQTIMKQFMDNYLQTYSAITTLITENPAKAAELMKAGSTQNSYLKEVSPNKEDPNTILNYYYALIAMTCMYGGFWGMKEVSAVQANQTPQGARISLTPVHKLKIFGYALCSVILIHLTSLVILIAYLGLILKVSFGHQLGYILLTCVAGSLMGVSTGALLGAVIKKGEGFKIAVFLMVSMVFSFLAGLMVTEVKYLVTTAVPIMAYLNPANLVTDAFYSLYYYDGYGRFFTNIGLLFGFSALFYLIVYAVLRRQKYASL